MSNETSNGMPPADGFPVSYEQSPETPIHHAEVIVGSHPAIPLDSPDMMPAPATADLTEAVSLAPAESPEVYPPDVRMQVLKSEEATPKAREAAFASIVIEHELDLNNYVSSVLRSSLKDKMHLAPDIVQDLFIKVWRKPYMFEHDPHNPYALKAWLLRMARNAAIDASRLKRNQETQVAEVFGDHGVLNMSNRRDDPVERVLFTEDMAEVRELTQGNYDYLMLRACGYSPLEIAEMLENSESGADGQIHRARQKVRLNLASLRDRY